jgi:phenylalanyl-tRNA synthetase beta chain
VPVVDVVLKRLERLVPGKKAAEIIEALPFIALDIEGIDEQNKIARIEYNPNRPDFSSDYGIARALKGLLGIEKGIPSFKLAGKSNCKILVDPSIRSTRQYIVGLVAKNGNLDDETIRQLIAMQEDLHNGIGRRRRKASIGIHNLDAISFPVTYKAVGSEFSFIPLGGSIRQTIEQILESEIGKRYRYILGTEGRYPVIIDRNNTILSFPPIINGNATKIDTSCKNIFVEVTATDLKTAEDMLAIIAVTLYDAGFDIQTLSISNVGQQKSQDRNSKKPLPKGDARPSLTTTVPRMQQKVMIIDVKQVNSMLGLRLSASQVASCLEKSRLGAKVTKKDTIRCIIPRYRIDIMHPVDLVEEVAIGFGVYNLEPTLPAAAAVGHRSQLAVHMDIIRSTMIGAGFLESLSSGLSGRKVQYELAERKTPEEDKALAVHSPKSVEHEVLRESLIPSLMQSLSGNVHEEYPQKLFEIGKVFKKKDVIHEYYSVGAVVAHAEADYTEAKSVLQALMELCFGKSVTTVPAKDPTFIEGRTAQIIIDDSIIGVIGEVSPSVVENFKLRMPVSAFEINLSLLFP